MKNKFILLFLLPITCSCSESKHPAVSTEEKPGPIEWEARRDTVLQETAYGSIYITNDKKLKYYDWLVPGDLRSMDPDERQFYNEMAVAVLDSHDVKMKHFPLGELPLKWAPLGYYNGNFYVHSPSDWMSHFNDVITDSVLYCIETDPGNSASAIMNVRSVSATTTRFELLDQLNKNYLNIIVVDRKRGIAVWELLDGNNKLLSRSLDVRKVKLFPMIIEDCGDAKCHFRWNGFTEPDYDSLIRNTK
jgi:hypothetical protein